MPNRITLSTVKAFIRKNPELFILTKSSFDGMTDCCQSTKNKFFTPAKFGAKFPENTMGIEGAWFVKGSRDYFRPYESGNFSGIEVYNCCGTFILAAKN